ncbi:MAG: acetate--CoA ligase family protein [Planctomycetota bacterium]|jgi:acetyltransferase
MATDAAIRHKLEIASLSEQTREKLKEVLPPTASIQNPVDVIGDATHERYEAAIQHILKDENVDSAIIILSPQAMTDVLETASIVPNVTKDIDKPVLCSFMGIVDVSEGVRHLEKHGIPNYAFPEAAVRTMAVMSFYGDLLNLDKRKVPTVSADRSAADALIKNALADKDSCYLPEFHANQILDCYGFPLLKTALLRDFSDIDKLTDEISFPAAMKISSPDIVHKFDAGGVRLKIKTAEAAKQAFQEIIQNAKNYNPSALIDGVIIEPMAKKGIEVILGAARDPKFGPVCMFGLGGTFVEAIKDVTFRIAPMWEISAEIMIRTIKAYTILQGVRGAPPSDIEGIKDCILRLSQMLTNHPEIAELDINPLIVYPQGQGCVVADSRILLTRPK